MATKAKQPPGLQLFGQPLRERAAILAGKFLPNDMKNELSDLWHLSRQKLGELNIKSVKKRKKLDEEVAQLCVIFVEKKYSKDKGVLNDVVVVKLVIFSDVLHCHSWNTL